MKNIGLSRCQLRFSSFRFIGLFPPKESMKEFVENRGRQDGTGPPDKYCRHFLTVGTRPHLSNIDIVVVILRTLQAFAWKSFAVGLRGGGSPRIYVLEAPIPRSERSLVTGQCLTC
jgi:hypothetical protein